MGDEPGALGRELAREALDVTLEEFRLTESRFETDSRLGRELLYLVSNTEWVRRTTEMLDISRVAAVETRVVVDVDVSYIAHEALRSVDGPIWLPLIALPRLVGPDPDGERADTPVSVDVLDGTGARVAEVPPAEVGRQLAAALSEALVTRLHRRTGIRDGEGGPATRDAQVLLAAVLARVLTRAAAGRRRGCRRRGRRPARRRGATGCGWPRAGCGSGWSRDRGGRAGGRPQPAAGRRPGRRRRGRPLHADLAGGGDRPGAPRQHAGGGAGRPGPGRPPRSRSGCRPGRWCAPRPAGTRRWPGSGWRCWCRARTPTG